MRRTLMYPCLLRKFSLSPAGISVARGDAQSMGVGYLLKVAIVEDAAQNGMAGESSTR